MNHVLDTLAHMAGVRTVALVTTDGVPITVRGSGSTSGEGGVDEHDALAALASGWVAEIDRAVAPLTWGAPRHLVLRAARGNLVAMHAPGALLVVVLDSGANVDELRMPMEAAVARMERQRRAETQRGSAGNDQPPAALPSRESSSTRMPVLAEDAGQEIAITGDGSPQTSGE